MELKFISGFWNMYYCDDCDFNFASANMDDVDGVMQCPCCHEAITSVHTDYIKRTKED